MLTSTLTTNINVISSVPRDIQQAREWMECMGAIARDFSGKFNKILERSNQMAFNDYMIFVYQDFDNGLRQVSSARGLEQAVDRLLDRLNWIEKTDKEGLLLDNFSALVKTKFFCIGLLMLIAEALGAGEMLEGQSGNNRLKLLQGRVNVTFNQLLTKVEQQLNDRLLQLNSELKEERLNLNSAERGYRLGKYFLDIEGWFIQIFSSEKNRQLASNAVDRFNSIKIERTQLEWDIKACQKELDRLYNTEAVFSSLFPEDGRSELSIKEEILWAIEESEQPKSPYIPGIPFRASFDSIA